MIKSCWSNNQKDVLHGLSLTGNNIHYIGHYDQECQILWKFCYLSFRLSYEEFQRNWHKNISSLDFFCQPSFILALILLEFLILIKWPTGCLNFIMRGVICNSIIHWSKSWPSHCRQLKMNVLFVLEDIVQFVASNSNQFEGIGVSKTIDRCYNWGLFNNWSVATGWPKTEGYFHFKRLKAQVQ